MIVAAMESFQVDVLGASELVVRQGSEVLHRLTANGKVERLTFGDRESQVEGWIEMYPQTAQIMCVIALRHLQQRHTQSYVELRREDVIARTAA